MSTSLNNQLDRLTDALNQNTNRRPSEGPVKPGSQTPSSPQLQPPFPRPGTLEPKRQAGRAWEGNAFWRAVVPVLTGGKRLRSSHYLEGLTAPELEQLRRALASAGSMLARQQLCPRRRGGDYDGELPDLTTLTRLTDAIRLATAPRDDQPPGVAPDVTNRVLNILAQRVIDPKAEPPPGIVAVATGNLLIRSEDARAKIKLREQAEARLDEKLELAWEKHEFNAAKRVLPLLPELQAIQKDNTLTDFEKLDQIRMKLFGCIAENEPQE